MDAELTIAAALIGLPVIVLLLDGWAYVGRRWWHRPTTHSQGG